MSANKKFAINIPLTNANNENISRHDLIDWVNLKLQAHFLKIEELCTGAAYCQFMDMLFPGSVTLKSVKFAAINDYEYLFNFKILQNGFRKARVNTPIPMNKLIKGHFQDNLAFLQWFYKFYSTNLSADMENYDPLTARGGIKLGSGKKIEWKQCSAFYHPPATALKEATLLTSQLKAIGKASSTAIKSKVPGTIGNTFQETDTDGVIYTKNPLFAALFSRVPGANATGSDENLIDESILNTFFGEVTNAVGNAANKAQPDTALDDTTDNSADSFAKEVDKLFKKYLVLKRDCGLFEQTHSENPTAFDVAVQDDGAPLATLANTSTIKDRGVSLSYDSAISNMDRYDHLFEEYKNLTKLRNAIMNNCEETNANNTASEESANDIKPCYPLENTNSLEWINDPSDNTYTAVSDEVKINKEVLKKQEINGDSSELQTNSNLFLEPDDENKSSVQK